MLTCEDAPKTLRLSEEREARSRILELDHIAPLTSLVRTIRVDRGLSREVPFFDPCDGGTKAQALFLLEAPGAKAVFSGFISRNNPDDSAKNSFELYREAGLPRDQVVLWNIVPWYVGTGDKIRPVDNTDIEQASRYLDQLLKLLPNLRALVLVGDKAQRAYARTRDWGPKVFTSPHPSPIPMRTRPDTRLRILAAWREVAQFLGHKSK